MPATESEQCTECWEWFPSPVCLHHAEDECFKNQREAEVS